MKRKYLVPIDRFRSAFQRLKWNEQLSTSGKYYIWTDPTDESIWTRQPIRESEPEYLLYQEKNIFMLLYALNQPETNECASELLSQLKEYNYKLTNRIVGKNNKVNSTIPFELANIITEKNIEAFRYFYQTKSKNKKQIPLERFELNHTEVGSFVIPISISVEEEKNVSFIPMQNDTNILIHKYLDAIETLTKIPRDSALQFADQVIENSIDSKIVKDFFGYDRSIARYIKKYASDINGVTIGSKGSLLLDYGLNQDQRNFKQVDISKVEALNEDYIRTLEEREIEKDETRIDIKATKIDVIVDQIDRNGKIKFTVTGIGDTDKDYSFKAYSNELPVAKLDVFADFFKNGGATVITGDISKTKGKVGKIIVDNIGSANTKTNKISLFDDF